MLDLFIKLILSLATFSATTMFTYVIFKIPVKQNSKEIVFLGLVVGAVNFYFKFVIESPYFFLAQTVTWIIMMTIIRKYPILFSLLFCMLGSIFISMVDGLVTLTAVGTHLSTMHRMINNSSDYTVLHIIVTVFYIIIAYIIAKLKIGFSFIRMSFKGQYLLRPYNFVWSAGMVLLVGMLQINANSYNTKTFNFYLISILTIVAIGVLVRAYFKNKSDYEDRFGIDGVDLHGASNYKDNS